MTVEVAGPTVVLCLEYALLTPNPGSRECITLATLFCTRLTATCTDVVDGAGAGGSPERVGTSLGKAPASLVARIRDG